MWFEEYQTGRIYSEWEDNPQRLVEKATDDILAYLSRAEKPDMKTLAEPLGAVSFGLRKLKEDQLRDRYALESAISGVRGAVVKLGVFVGAVALATWVLLRVS